MEHSLNVMMFCVKVPVYKKPIKSFSVTSGQIDGGGIVGNLLCYPWRNSGSTPLGNNSSLPSRALAHKVTRGFHHFEVSKWVTRVFWRKHALSDEVRARLMRHKCKMIFRLVCFGWWANMMYSWVQNASRSASWFELKDGLKHLRAYWSWILVKDEKGENVQSSFANQFLVFEYEMRGFANIHYYINIFLRFLAFQFAQQIRIIDIILNIKIIRLPWRIMQNTIQIKWTEKNYLVREDVLDLTKFLTKCSIPVTGLRTVCKIKLRCLYWKLIMGRGLRLFIDVSFGKTLN